MLFELEVPEPLEKLVVSLLPLFLALATFGELLLQVSDQCVVLMHVSGDVPVLPLQL